MVVRGVEVRGGGDAGGGDAGGGDEGGANQRCSEFISHYVHSTNHYGQQTHTHTSQFCLFLNQSLWATEHTTATP